MRVSFTIARALMLLGTCIAAIAYLWCGHENLAAVVESVTTTASYTIRSIPGQFGHAFASSTEHAVYGGRLVQPPALRSKISVHISDIYTTIINKPEEIYYRSRYFIREFPATVKDQAAELRWSIITAWDDARNPHQILAVRGPPIYFLESRGFYDDGGEKFEVTYLNTYITEGTYVHEPLTVSSAARFVVRAVRPTVKTVFDGAFVIGGTTIYASLYAMIDFIQRFHRAGEYAAFLACDWWINDFAVSVLLETVILDVPQAYRTSYLDICEFVAMLYPYATSAVDHGYPIVASLVSSTPKILQSIVGYGMRALSYAQCEQNPDHIICVQNDDWIVLVAALLVFSLVSNSFSCFQPPIDVVFLAVPIRVPAISCQPLLRIYLHRHHVPLASLDPGRKNRPWDPPVDNL